MTAALTEMSGFFLTQECFKMLVYKFDYVSMFSQLLSTGCKYACKNCVFLTRTLLNSATNISIQNWTSLIFPD